MKEETLKKARQKRGQVEEEQIAPYLLLPETQLLAFLQDADPLKRTIGATVLGNRKVDGAVLHLCKALEKEKSLYAKLAICKALVEIGAPGVEPLIKVLGKIGKNQETTLPEKYFEKKSYPLARDIAARTLISIGKPAVEKVITLSNTKDRYLLSQVIDTLGGLLHQTGDKKIVDRLKNILAQEQSDVLLLWKTIRAFSAHKEMETVQLVLPFLTHPQVSIRWEAARTIGLTASFHAETVEKMKRLMKDPNEQVRRAAKDALERIKV